MCRALKVAAVVILSVDDKGKLKWACIEIILEEEMEATGVITATFARASGSGAEVNLSLNNDL